LQFKLIFFFDKLDLISQVGALEKYLHKNDNKDGKKKYKKESRLSCQQF